MADGDIYEKFEATTWDYENEFNPNRFRKSKSQTKKQQIYGIWADDSDEEAEEVTLKEDKFSGVGTKRKKASRGPISFISGGLKGAEEEGEPDGESHEEASTSSGGKRKEEKFTGFAGQRRPAMSSNWSSDPSFGKWEAHTKGIGAKLLTKMGYEPGKGLGKNLQGITAPIEAKPRSGKGSVGMYGPEHKQAAAYGDGRVKDGKEKAKAKPEKTWKKADASEGKKEKTKYIYKSVDEVLAEDGPDSRWQESEKLSRVKVIDMRGPEQRVLSGYHQIHQKQLSKPKSEEVVKKEKRVFVLDELEHNLELLVSVSEQDILRNNRELRRERERLLQLEEERECLKERIVEEKRQVDTMKRVVTQVQEMNQKFRENKLHLEQVIDFCLFFVQESLEEYKVFSLSHVVISLGFPLMENKLIDWKPINEPTSSQSLKLFRSWKTILEPVDTTLYESLMWEIWMPSVRRALTEWPSIRQCDEVIAFLESWKPLLPDWLLNNILEQIVLPRLEKEVEDWKPLTDTVPVHSWIHPWLPLMEDRSLESVYATIRHKLSQALTNWHPSDSSARLILEPWKGVFSPGVWESFLALNIVPKLELVMQPFEINPHRQRLDVWSWLMAWEDMLSIVSLSSILEKNFLPKWLDVLYKWLSHTPDFEEVTKWYSGWKSMFSPSLASQPVIKDAFRRALEMMDYSVSPQGMSAYKFPSNQPNQSQQEPARARQEAPSSLSATNNTINFKQLIARRAEEHGILFMPIPNRTHEGKQVYRFANLTIYLDRAVVFVYNNGQWFPTSLQALVDSAV